ncbi:hypothetical protein AYR54_11665 (plasmid) [Loigolactobacillus backii]|nr:hypothetical protein AYR54_11665 [Loigolactobacillus backii]
MFFVQTNHTRKELLFLMFLKINLRNHSSLHKLFYSLQRLAEPMLVQVFRNAIAHDLTLEVNAKSIVLRHNLGYMNMRLSYGSHLVALNSL